MSDIAYQRGRDESMVERSLNMHQTQAAIAEGAHSRSPQMHKNYGMEKSYG